MNKKSTIMPVFLFLFLILFVTPVHAAAKTGFVTENGETYYIKKDGTKQKGWLTLKGKKYYFDKKTGVQVKGWTKNMDGHRIRYFTMGSGRMLTGYATDSEGNTRYFDPETGIVKRGWMEDSKGYKYFFYEEDGIMAKGWYTITYNGKKRYFNKKNGRMVTGWVKNSKNQYRYFHKTNGIMYTGLKEIDGDTYYFSKTNGIRYQKGLGKGYWSQYYFSPEDGKAKKGWMEIDGKMYYFGENYQMYKLKKVTIDGKDYRFDSDGVATETKFPEYVTVDGDIRLYDRTNKRYYYVQKEFLEHEGIENEIISDFTILSTLCESEASDMGLIGMEAAALCILNRTIDESKLFPSQVRTIVYQTRPVQFESINNGIFAKNLRKLWIFPNDEPAHNAARAAMKIFEDYLKDGTPRTLPGFDREDFNFLHFMKEDLFWKQDLDFDKIDKFLYNGYMFY